ncbi:conserved virulence factor C family protein [Anaerobacillus sp. MEB173]|uniref:conserved virulence factor C family protein n=1 Tax=Anaerobacillus sp. MEB173 TaxID=3383345 RepID=UPI003F930BFD
MKIKSIEPTPSPNSMKITLDETLPHKVTKSFKKEQRAEAPPILRSLLEIAGVKSVFHVADFIAIERNAKVDWQIILPKVREAFGEQAKTNQTIEKSEHDESFGEVKVFVQMFRGIPMQVKLDNGVEEKRFGLGQRFIDAALKAEGASNNLVMERQWKEQGIRYGEMAEIGEEVTEEIIAAYDYGRLNTLVKKAFEDDFEEHLYRVKITSEQVAAALKNDDWKVRYAALEKMDPKESDISLLASALNDSKVSIRRLATVYLGMIDLEEVLPYLYQALKDPAVTVRRTAGDCLSDIGNPKAIPAMVEALKDNNKLVRWRAAMFLYEVGDNSAVAALHEAANDPEFEVSLQVKMALKRIESGAEAAGSVWQQMTNARKDQQ